MRCLDCCAQVHPHHWQKLPFEGLESTVNAIAFNGPRPSLSQCAPLHEVNSTRLPRAEGSEGDVIVNRHDHCGSTRSVKTYCTVTKIDRHHNVDSQSCSHF
jgi:hypothetical protein